MATMATKSDDTLTATTAVTIQWTTNVPQCPDYVYRERHRCTYGCRNVDRDADPVQVTPVGLAQGKPIFFLSFLITSNDSSGHSTVHRNQYRTTTTITATSQHHHDEHDHNHNYY